MISHAGRERAAKLGPRPLGAATLRDFAGFGLRAANTDGTVKPIIALLILRAVLTCSRGRIRRIARSIVAVKLRDMGISLKAISRHLSPDASEVCRRDACDYLRGG
jgi:hypothetical protein